MTKYAKSQNARHFRVGDTVRINRTAKDHEDGWGTVWAGPMTKNVGKLGVVEDISPFNGLSVRTKLDTWWHPHFVLTIVKRAPKPPKVYKVKLNKNYTAKVDAASVKVGCQTFTHAKILQLAKLVGKLKKK